MPILDHPSRCVDRLCELCKWFDESFKLIRDFLFFLYVYLTHKSIVLWRIIRSKPIVTGVTWGADLAATHIFLSFFLSSYRSFLFLSYSGYITTCLHSSSGSPFPLILLLLLTASSIAQTLKQKPMHEKNSRGFYSKVFVLAHALIQVLVFILSFTSPIHLMRRRHQWRWLVHGYLLTTKSWLLCNWLVIWYYGTLLRQIIIHNMILWNSNSYGCNCLLYTFFFLPLIFQYVYLTLLLLSLLELMPAE